MVARIVRLVGAQFGRNPIQHRRLHGVGHVHAAAVDFTALGLAAGVLSSSVSDSTLSDKYRSAEGGIVTSNVHNSTTQAVLWATR